MPARRGLARPGAAASTSSAAPAPPDAAAAVQVRIMGEDAAAVEAIADALAATGLVAWTGRAPTRRGPGLRVYGAAVLVRKGGG